MASIDPFVEYLNKKRDPFHKYKEVKQEEGNVEQAISEANKNILTSIKSYIKANKYIPPPLAPPPDFDKEVSSRLPPPVDIDKIIVEATNRALKNLPVIVSPPAPPQIIREKTIEKQIIEKEQAIEFKEEEKLAKGLQKEIEALKEMVERLKEFAVFHGGSGVIGIPNPAGQRGKNLGSDGVKAIWETVSGGGTSGTTITLSNDSTNPSVGDWRLTISGTSLLVQRYESGVWTEKGAFLA